MKEVGGTTTDISAMIGYVGEELATIRRTAQGFLVSIQDGDVATVAGQRVKHAGTHRGRYSVGDRQTDRMINGERTVFTWHFSKFSTTQRTFTTPVGIHPLTQTIAH